MTINTSNRCLACRGTVHNIDGKRYTIERLTELHNQSCPGRGIDQRTPTTNESENQPS